MKRIFYIPLLFSTLSSFAQWQQVILEPAKAREKAKEISWVKKSESENCITLQAPTDRIGGVTISKCNDKYTLTIRLQSKVTDGDRPVFSFGDIAIQLSQEEGKKLYDIFHRQTEQAIFEDLLESPIAEKIEAY